MMKQYENNRQVKEEEKNHISQYLLCYFPDQKKKPQEIK